MLCVCVSERQRESESSATRREFSRTEIEDGADDFDIFLRVRLGMISSSSLDDFFLKFVNFYV